MAQRARTEVDARHAPHVGMVAQWVTQARVLVQQRPVEEAEISEDGVYGDGRVALSQEEPVAIRPRGVAAAQTQHAVVQRRDDLSRRERGGVVPRLGN